MSSPLNDRRFTRLRPGPASDHPGTFEVPEPGICLSVFLVIESPESPYSILFGKINPAAPWWPIGAIDPDRIGRIGDRWMLPSCQLLFYESPEAAATRILKEQLSTDDVRLNGPEVFSDPSFTGGRTSGEMHWDFHFVYRGTWGEITPPAARPWRQLAFLDVRQMSRDEICRNQGDVLELIGLRLKDTEPPPPSPR
jgi:hypothetical protein